jgi:hypothetical protein
VEAPRGDLGGDLGAPLSLPQLGLGRLGASGSDAAAYDHYDGAGKQMAGEALSGTGEPNQEQDACASEGGICLDNEKTAGSPISGAGGALVFFVRARKTGETRWPTSRRAGSSMCGPASRPSGGRAGVGPALPPDRAQRLLRLLVVLVANAERTLRQELVRVVVQPIRKPAPRMQPDRIGARRPR